MLFRSQGSGYILNVASSAGFMAGPLMATYYATKNYVLRLTQAIREEQRRSGNRVQVAVLCPGPVDTEFNRVAGVRFALPGMQVSQVAQFGVDGLFAGKGILVPGLGMRTMVTLSKWVPDCILPRITYRIQQQKVEGGEKNAK